MMRICVGASASRVAVGSTAPRTITAPAVRNVPRFVTSAVAERSEAENVALVEVTKRIRDLGRDGKLKMAVGELAQFARLGFQPDAQAASALLDACVKNKKMEMAEAVFQDLFGEVVEPDDVTFCILLRGYGASDPPKWEKVQSWLKRMETDYGIKPTTVVYNTLLEICSRTKDLEMAETFVDRMAAQGVRPNELTAAIVSKRRAMRGLVRRLEQYIEEEEEEQQAVQSDQAASLMKL
ncbi:hypothetical protein BSKO_08181 [Bryopsis sp. KO-2023]|nr:hypothetical protein BSKO_08181 [Bryopsis sp. KO-2023]